MCVGKPSSRYDQDNPDWTPSLKMGYNQIDPTITEKRMNRYARLKSRRNRKENSRTSNETHEEGVSNTGSNVDQGESNDEASNSGNTEESGVNDEVVDAGNDANGRNVGNEDNDHGEGLASIGCQCTSTMADVGCQSTLTMDHVNSLEEKVAQLDKRMKVSDDKVLEKNTSFLKLYTGNRSYQLFL